MGKNIKFFKKLTSLVLAGLTVFSAVPVKAWKAEDPRADIEEQVNSMLKNGYKYIFCDDYENCEIGVNQDTRNCGVLPTFGLILKNPGLTLRVISSVLSSEGLLLSVDNEYYKALLEIMKIKNTSIVQLDMPCPQDNEDEHFIYKKLDFPNLVKVNIRVKKSGSRGFQQTSILVDKNENGLLQGTFSSCQKIKLVYVEGNGIVEFLDENGQKVEEGSIDLFPACQHGVIVICDTQEQVNGFKNIMGDKGKRHKVFLKKDLKKFDEANREPLKLDKSTEVITLESTDEVRIEMSQFHESKNIIIPKNVKKIEKCAFKNVGLCGVTFEEGMEEIEFCDECFASCPLVKFELPKSLKKITLRNNCFENCDNRVAIEGYIKAEQTRIQNEEIERLRKEEEKRRLEAERKRKEEEERKRKEEEEKMKRKKEELEKWKKEVKQKIEDQKAELQKEISGDRDGDEIFDQSSLVCKRMEAQGVKNQCENELRKFLENHPEYITNEDIKLFKFNNKLIETAKTKFSSNKSSEIDKIRAELILKEDKLLRSKLEVAKLKVELYDEKINSRKSLIKSLDKQLKILDKIEEIKEEFLGCLNLIAGLKVKEKAAELKLEETKKQEKANEEFYNELKKKEELQEEIRIQQEKEAQEQARLKEEQERIAKQQAEEQKRLDEEKRKFEAEKNKGLFSRLGEKINSLNPIKSVTDTLGNMGHKVVLGCKIALGTGATVLGLMGIGLVVRTVTSVVNFCTSVKKLFTSKSEKVVPQKTSNSTSNTSATLV